MKQLDIRRFGLILAIQAEIEGMKAKNELNKLYENSPVYRETDFQDKAEELRNLSSCPDEKL